MSDMLHNTTGHKTTDHYRSIELCLAAIDFTNIFLEMRGTLVCKFLRGSDDQELLSAAKNHFRTVKLVKPKSSRPESAEIYLLGINKF